MTKEEFISGYEALKAQKKETEAKIDALKEEYIKSLPFKVGDCVRLFDDRGWLRVEKAWIASIGFDFGTWLSVKYSRPKSDGTKSLRAELVTWNFNPENVELITDEPC